MKARDVAHWAALITLAIALLAPIIYFAADTYECTAIAFWR